jgi:plastocyanin
MKIRQTIPLVSATLALTIAFPLNARTGQDDVIVNFGDPIMLAGAGNQVVVPEEVSIDKGGTVTFIVNGPGHGIALYPVSKDTTRDSITAQLCEHDPVTGACSDPGFANGDHEIRDGKDNVIIVTGMNPPFQRVDDPTDRLLGTSTQVGDLAGAFLEGKTATTFATHLQFRFTKSGRYLAVCMNRNHYLNNWMFGFVTVGGGGD